jgi:hypothetical protein
MQPATIMAASRQCMGSHFFLIKSNSSTDEIAMAVGKMSALHRPFEDRAPQRQQRHSVDFGFSVTVMTPAVSRPHSIARVCAETIAA